jgi:hypothetical protein
LPGDEDLNAVFESLREIKPESLVPPEEIAGLWSLSQKQDPPYGGAGQGGHRQLPNIVAR